MYENVVWAEVCKKKSNEICFLIFGNGKIDTGFAGFAYIFANSKNAHRQNRISRCLSRWMETTSSVGFINHSIEMGFQSTHLAEILIGIIEDRVRRGVSGNALIGFSSRISVNSAAVSQELWIILNSDRFYPIMNGTGKKCQLNFVLFPSCKCYDCCCFRSLRFKCGICFDTLCLRLSTPKQICTPLKGTEILIDTKCLENVRESP